MPGLPRPYAEKTPTSLAANCRAANFIRHLPAVHASPAACPLSMPLGKSKIAHNDSSGSNLFLKKCFGSSPELVKGKDISSVTQEG